ncbi:DUF3047 domain-containing protein [Caenimonas sedimenti]|uniref:DUF3047 domain-containing protein n=1 Tax=Caenimonas sedimenti TaxID=2596921 RepID=UPI003D79D9E7
MTRRQVVLGAAALALPPWRAAQAQAGAGVPRFSASAPGGALPAGWAHETLPKVERANQFALVADGGVTVLHVRSQAAASSLVATLPTGGGSVARAQWRWKVSRALAGSDFRVKPGDDYAARLYVLFDLPLDRLAFADRLRIQATRSLSGRDIPTAAICYVWGQAQPVGSTGWNPYTDRVRMVVVDSGQEFAGQWRSIERDLARDWQEAFPGPMPPVRAVAVGADTDNTSDQVDTWFGDVRLPGTA